MRRHVAWLPVVLVACTACDLTEVAITQPEDYVIAEILLRQGATEQTAYLHRTTTGTGESVRDAIIVVTEDGTGRELLFSAAPDSLCLVNAPASAGTRGTCYRVAGTPNMIRPGTRYSLRIDLIDGRVMTGTTLVPGDFRIIRPAATSCRLDPGTALPLIWTPSANAAVYVAETRLNGIYSALRAAGVPVVGEGQLVLTALSITAADTTMAFPADFGIFDRFDTEAHEVLVAIRGGLPRNVIAEIIVAAADNNYVSWARGGNFNPSGLVRISSIQGDGRGVFGSLVPRDFEVRTTDPRPPLPTTPCR